MERERKIWRKKEKEMEREKEHRDNVGQKDR